MKANVTNIKKLAKTEENVQPFFWQDPDGTVFCGGFGVDCGMGVHRVMVSFHKDLKPQLEALAQFVTGEYYDELTWYYGDLDMPSREEIEVEAQKIREIIRRMAENA